MKKNEEIYTYDKYKDYCGEIKNFFEGLDLSNLSAGDLKKINFLKDAWIDYEMKYVSASYVGAGDERSDKTSEIIIFSNSVEDKKIKEKLLKFAYDYVIEMKYEEIFYGGEEDKINKSLVSSGLLDIDSYISCLEQVKTLKMI